MINYVEGDDDANAIVADILASGANTYAHKADFASEDQVASMFGVGAL